MWLDNASNIDYLFYSPYSEIISNIVCDKNNTPITVGVFGLWGAGKSTLLNLITNKLEDEQQVTVITINAWTFESYEDAKIALMEAILKEIETERPFASLKEKIKNLLSRVDYLKFASTALATGVSIANSFTAENSIPIAFAVARTAGYVADGIASVKDSLSNDSVVDNIRNFRKEFITLLDEAKSNLVIIVDDLDRCNPERIIETLEAIKLFLSVKNTAFVIAADENVIQYAIKNKYPHIEGSTVELSTEYIEKIIQLPIYIPELSSKDIENYLLLLITQKYLSIEDFEKLIIKIYEDNLITKLSRIEISEINKIIEEKELDVLKKESFMMDIQVVDNIRHIISSTLKGNPRQAKRFLNAFVTKRELARMYYGDEIDVQMLAKLMVLQKIDPYLFNQLNEWNKEFDTQNEQFIKMEESIKNDDKNDEFKRWNIAPIKQWLNCEPQNVGLQRLDKYFYLTREHLKQSIIDETSLSEKAREILEKIGSCSMATISTLVEQMKELNTRDMDNVVAVIIPKFINGKLPYFVMSSIYLNFDIYRDKIIKAINERKTSVGMGDIVYLKKMHTATPKEIEETLESLQNNNKISNSIMKKITEE